MKRAPRSSATVRSASCGALGRDDQLNVDATFARPLDRLARDLLAVLLDGAPEGTRLVTHPAGRPGAEHDDEAIIELSRELDRRVERGTRTL